MNEIIHVLRRGIRLEVDYLPQYDEAFSEAFAAAKKEVSSMHKHAQMAHVRAILEALREEEAHLARQLPKPPAQMEDAGAYDAELMHKRHQVRDEAGGTGQAWTFNEREEMQTAGWSQEKIGAHRQRRAAEMAQGGNMAGALELLEAPKIAREAMQALPNVAARRAAFEILSAYLARWGKLPNIEDFKQPYDDEAMQTSTDGAFHANAKWHRWGRFIMNRLWELERKEGITTRQEQAERISDALAEKRDEELRRFDLNAAGFGRTQLQRIVDFHNKTGFDAP